MHHVAIQRSVILRARFMTEIYMYDLAMFFLNTMNAGIIKYHN